MKPWNKDRAERLRCGLLLNRRWGLLLEGEEALLGDVGRGK